MPRVGSEVQVHASHRVCTGIQRVIRELHGDLDHLLSANGADLVPFHTKDWPRVRNYREDPYLASDPVLRRDLVEPEELDALLFLDLNVQMDFARIYRLRKQRRVPTFYLLYDLLPLSGQEWFPAGADRSFRVYLQQVLRVADHIITISDKVAGDLASLGWRTSAQVHPLHLGSAFPQRTAPEVDHLALLYVSTIEPRKGHDVLLDAFDLLVERGCDVELTLVGRRGWHFTDIEDRVQRHPDHGRRLHWHTAVDDFEMRRIASRCNVGVMPARDEGFGLFVEEALTCGLNVVASDIPVFRERAQPNLTFAALTAVDLADAVEEAGRRAHEPARVRSMSDFTSDVAELVLKEIGARRRPL